ncbi:serine hydrolase domain-containing protein [Leptospira jelokensis]|nr:serine hydrolase domain-containing protein [Leptospira jelokensis]
MNNQISIFILLLSMAAIVQCSVPKTKEERTKSFLSEFESLLEGKTDFKGGQFLVSIGPEEHFGSYGQSSPKDAFHSASVGKLFTMVLIRKLSEKGKISLNDPIHKYLNKELLKDLFVYEGIDYASEVTVEQLLSHTSGVNDYFESKGIDGIDFIQIIQTKPNIKFEPVDLISYTQKNQKASFPPGKGFLYSDTGYILLGLIIESITKQKFENVLTKEILKPLDMLDTYMYKRSTPLSGKLLPISPIYLGTVEVTNFDSVTADWAGGGLITTTNDLLKFQKAVWNGKLLSNSKPLDWIGNHSFHTGILYGSGFMTIDYGEIFFLLRGTPKMYGHSGILGTLLFYNPELDLHVVANFGGSNQLESSFRWMLHVVRIAKEINISHE